MTRHLLAATTFALCALGVLDAVPARACDVCQLQLKHRTGPYAITLAKDSPSTRLPRIRVTVANHGAGAVGMGGQGRSSRLVVNVVAPNYRMIDPVDASVAPERPALIRPRSSSTFVFKLLNRFNKPGVYRLNVTLRNVDSNVLTYRVE